MLEDLSYYLVEKLGEAIGGGGMPAAVLVAIVAVFSRTRKALVVAGMIGSQLVPFTSLLTLFSRSQQHLMKGDLVDTTIQILFLLAIGALVGALAYLIVLAIRGPAAQ